MILFKVNGNLYLKLEAKCVSKKCYFFTNFKRSFEAEFSIGDTDKKLEEKFIL